MTHINQFLWAKKNGQSYLLKWLSLSQHSKDTRAVIGLLWEHWLSEGQRQFVMQTTGLNEVRVKDLVSFLGTVHDIGKATPAFQAKRTFGEPLSLHESLMDKLEYAGFKGISDLKLRYANKSHHALAGQCILTWNGVGEDLASVIGGHHGMPISQPEECQIQKSYTANYFLVEDPQHDIYIRWQTAQKQVLNWALNLNGFKSVEELPFVPQNALVILSGLVIMADWIASNENYFPLLSIDQSEAIDQESRISFGWKTWHKTKNWEVFSYVDAIELYMERFNFEPRNVQKVFSRVIEDADSPGIFILEAPMGIGKTEAALVGVEQLAVKTQRNGMFFGLPTQATSNGIFPRILDWANQLIDESGDPLGIRLAHGKAALNEEFHQLSSQINIDEDKYENLMVNEWFSGRKKTALDDFVTGTVDQFLLSALKQKHLALRHLGFSKKVVVIDEVHAYDAYMSQYLNQAILWMGAYGVPLIILSATLPSEKREEMIKSYLRGQGASWGKVNKPESGLETNDYPLITYTDGVIVRQETQFEPIANKRISIINLEEENVFELLENIFNKGGVIGVILNTVARSQAFAEECTKRFDKDSVELIHSRFIATHRSKKEASLIKLIGKNAKRPEKKIIIGTQVLEQSLDIDFDVLITDLAPMDLLLQRIGRLHRHVIARPDHLTHPTVYILGNCAHYNFEKGSSRVYGDYLLMRTSYFLPEEILLPANISPLVQKVYGDEPLILEEDDLKKYESVKNNHRTRVERKKNKAKIYRIEAPILFKTIFRSPSLVGWLSNTHPNQNEEFGYAQVRDIQDSVEVVALKKIGSGYGVFGEDEDLSKTVHDPDVARRLAQESLVLPIALTTPDKIDDIIKELERYNSIRLSSWADLVFLRGSLGIIFDENDEFFLCGYCLSYDKKYGLSMQRM